MNTWVWGTEQLALRQLGNLESPVPVPALWVKGRNSIHSEVQQGPVTAY